MPCHCRHRHRRRLPYIYNYLFWLLNLLRRAVRKTKDNWHAQITAPVVKLRLWRFMAKKNKSANISINRLRARKWHRKPRAQKQTEIRFFFFPKSSYAFVVVVVFVIAWVALCLCVGVFLCISIELWTFITHNRFTFTARLKNACRNTVFFSNLIPLHTFILPHSETGIQFSSCMICFSSFYTRLVTFNRADNLIVI